MSKWITFFSQTGSEINNIRKAFNRDPDLIITNRYGFDESINEELKDACKDRFVFIPRRPVLENYLNIIDLHREIFNNCIITLNGYLRIIPPELCNMFTIYNLHPGLISRYPELRGFNPQERAYNGGYETSGAVIHRVVAEVDAGDIIESIEVPIKGLTLDQVYSVLHKKSTELWIKFLKDKI